MLSAGLTLDKLCNVNCLKASTKGTTFNIWKMRWKYCFRLIFSKFKFNFLFGKYEIFKKKHNLEFKKGKNNIKTFQKT